MLVTTKNHYSSLLESIETNNAKVGIIGLGYVGLPTAYFHLKKGFETIGFDLSQDKIDSINNGISYIEDITDEQMREMTEHYRFKATTDFSHISEMDVLLICVPTPINEYKEPELSYVNSAAETIAANVKEGALVILESTTYPGSTEEYVVPHFEKRGMTVGETIFIAYSPERIDPGNQKFGPHNTPKVVGGLTNKCTDLAAAFFGEISYKVSSVRVAEMTKVLENSFRYVNIGFVNESAVLCNKMGIDIWEVLNASSTKPYGFMKFSPGIGVGGHCIPVDPYYLTYKAREYGERTRMIELAGDINDHMTEYTYHRVMEILNDSGKLMKEANVVVLGAAYKENISDVRESPVLPLLDRLSFKVGKLSIVEPYVDKFSYKNVFYKTSQYSTDLLQNADLVIIATPHEKFNYKEIADHSKVILDTKDIFAKKRIHSEYVIKL